MTEGDPATDAPPTPPPPRRYRRLGLLTFTSAILLAAAVLLGQQLLTEPSDVIPEEMTFGAALTVPAGGVASLGTMEIDNPDRVEMQVEGIRLLATSGVELVDATVITPNDRTEHGYYDAGPQFPPNEWPYPTVRPLNDPVPPSEFSSAPPAPLTLKVMIGVQALREGMIGFNGVEIDYRAGGRRRTERFAHGLIMCAPPSRCADVDSFDAMVELGLLRE